MVPPLQVQVTPVVPPLVFNENFEILKNVFLLLQKNFFIKKIVLDELFNVWKCLKHFFNFLKFFVVPPLPVIGTPVVPRFVLNENFEIIQNVFLLLQNNFFEKKH